jgi:hypothetical protein
MAQWYVSIGDKTTGPFSTEQVLEDVKQNRISPDATVCAVGDTRFVKITDEPTLAKGFAASAGTPLPQVAAKKCCPMARVAAVTSLLATGGFWAVASVSTSPVLAGVAALAGLFFAIGIARKKSCAHCPASALHLVGLVGAVYLVAAKSGCPTLYGVAAVHALGFLATRGAKRQLCSSSSCGTEKPTTI